MKFTISNHDLFIRKAEVKWDEFLKPTRGTTSAINQLPTKNLVSQAAPRDFVMDYITEIKGPTAALIQKNSNPQISPLISLCAAVPTLFASLSGSVEGAESDKSSTDREEHQKTGASAPNDSSTLTLNLKDDPHSSSTEAQEDEIQQPSPKRRTGIPPDISVQSSRLKTNTAVLSCLPPTKVFKCSHSCDRCRSRTFRGDNMTPECSRCRGPKMHCVYRLPFSLNRSPFDSMGDFDRRTSGGGVIEGTQTDSGGTVD